MRISCAGQVVNGRQHLPAYCHIEATQSVARLEHLNKRRRKTPDRIAVTIKQAGTRVLFLLDDSQLLSKDFVPVLQKLLAGSQDLVSISS